jgi:hypothetical protein
VRKTNQKQRRRARQGTPPRAVTVATLNQHHRERCRRHGDRAYFQAWSLIKSNWNPAMIGDYLVKQCIEAVTAGHNES